MRTLKHDLPLLNALAVFEVAAQYCNNTITAQTLGIAQSAVSRHISNLEAHTNLILFERNGNRLALTDDGKKLAEAASVGLGQIRDTIVTLQRKSRNRPFTIGCTYDMANMWLMPHFESIRNLLGKRELRLLTADTYNELDTPDIDLSIRYGNGNWPGFKAVKLFDEEIFPICSPRLLEQKPELAGGDPNILRKATLLDAPRDINGPSYWYPWFNKFGVEFKEVGEPVFSSYIFMLYEILAGNGVGLGWSHVLTPQFNTRQLVRLSDQSVSTGKAFYAVFPEQFTDQDIHTVVICLSEIVSSEG